MARNEEADRVRFFRGKTSQIVHNVNLSPRMEDRNVYYCRETKQDYLPVVFAEDR